MKDDHLTIEATGRVGDDQNPKLTVLIDTGAQVDLIKKGLVPTELLTTAQTPM